MNTIKFCDKCGLKLDVDCVDCPNCRNNFLNESTKFELPANIKDTVIGTEFIKNFKNLDISKLKSETVKESQKLENVQVRLVLEKGGTDGREFPIYSTITNIGRWDPHLDSHPEVDLSDEDIKAKVSRIHAKIIKKDEGFYIEDMGSRNGTYLNREYKLVKGVEYHLKNNDEIIIGHLFLRFIFS